MVTKPTLKGAEVHVNRPLIMLSAPQAIPCSAVWWRDLTGHVKAYKTSFLLFLIRIL